MIELPKYTVPTYNPRGLAENERTENIPCKTLTEAVELGSILTDEEKMMSFIEDRARHKKLTLKGKE